MMLDKEEQKRKKLAELGIDYEFPGYVIYYSYHNLIESRYRAI